MPAKRLHLPAVGTVRLVIAMARAVWRCLTPSADMREMEQTKGRHANFHTSHREAKVHFLASLRYVTGGITGGRNHRVHAIASRSMANNGNINMYRDALLHWVSISHYPMQSSAMRLSCKPPPCHRN
jgi:hypothetical protein